MANIREVIDIFNFKGDFVDVEEFGSGHINKTYLVKFNNEGSEQRYILQQLNDNVFKNIEQLMKNVFAVTSYLRSVIKENGGDPDRETLHYIHTKDGNEFYKSPEDNTYYRAYIFVRDSVSFNTAENAEMFKSSGEAFGKFQRLLSDFNAEELTETIPHFHDTLWRYNNEFVPALEKNASGRLDT